MPSLSDSLVSPDRAVTRFRIEIGCTIANLSTVSTLSCYFVYFEGYALGIYLKQRVLTVV